MKRVWTFGALFLTLGTAACGGDSRDDLMSGAGTLTNATGNDDSDDADDAGSVVKPAPSNTTDPDDEDPPSSSPDAGDTSDTDAGDPSKPPPEPGSVDDIDDFAKTTLDRALQWVKIKMPYCGGTNHGTDWLCGGTCERSGVHATPQWDPYRTDCSGFVSWSWKLPAPGRITTDFAPFYTDNTTVIDVDDLRPGDALNNKTHIILFGGWANSEHTKARLLEEYDCGQVAVDRIRNISKSSKTQVNVPGSGTFSAIRLDSRP